MSATPFTLQCHRCAGYFRAAAAARSRVRCPHCEWEALVAEFRQIGEGELPSVALAPSPDPAPTAQAWEVRGKRLQFGCPHCQRPMRMAADQAGGLADCPHCGLEIVAPDPDAGSAARLSDASRRGLGALADFKPRSLRGGGMRTPVVRADTPPAAGASTPPVVKTGTPPVVRADTPSVVETGTPSVVRAPVRMLGVEALGSAFKARDDLNVPQAFAWDADAAPSPPELAPRAEPLPRERRGAVWVFAAVLFFGALGVMFVVLGMRRGGEGQNLQAPGVEQRIAAVAIDEARHAAAFDVARRAVGARDWRDMALLVRARARVGGLMAEYYRERAFAPVVLTAFEDPVTGEASGTTYVQLRAETAGGVRRLVGVEETADGRFLFDWELWVDIARVEWRRFVDQRPSAPQELRVTMARNSPQARYLTDAGFDRGEARGVRLWLDNAAEPIHAILSAADPADAAVWEELSWNFGRRVVAEISYPSGAIEMDRVRIHRIVQPRWLRP